VIDGTGDTVYWEVGRLSVNDPLERWILVASLPLAGADRRDVTLNRSVARSV